MATPTYTLIDSTVLGSSASSVTFSSIPATYRDLVLVVRATQSTGSAKDAGLRFNSDSGSNYYQVAMGGSGSTANSGTNSATSRAVLNYWAYTGGGGSDFALYINEIMDYSATDKHKIILTRSNNASLGTDAVANRWADTSAITSVEFDWYLTGDVAAGSTFYLYGIEA